ncbi:hypothetical protein EYM_01350 [Ignicoccus islandicus DSM 13165]|uniref:Thiolase C-terminal domain-containing protein n=1 Tax=Ignicoccus islandicus DSM 13165 TaxID=940295 RepID=A0A0U3E2R3_9CREN|nr:hypothetical protein [Ignicoccus islandicus]ALU12203.1 hypothetical protein EYM_01350 [Ignicoccus islandicus DSM 13165]
MYVCDVAVRPIGREYSKSTLDMALEVSSKVIDSCGEPEAIVFSTYASTFQEKFGNIAFALAEALGLDAETYEVRAGDGSGGAAIAVGTKLVKAGFKKVLVVGADKTNDFHSKHAVSHLRTLIQPYETIYGLTYSAVHALAAKLYMKKYGVSHEDLLQWAVLMHDHATEVPHAQLKFQINLKKALNGTIVSEPLNLFDSHPFSDGAAAVMITSESAPVKIETASATHVLSVSKRDLTFMYSTKKAIERLGVDVESIEGFEVYDPFSIAGIIALESLGLAERGEGLKVLDEMPNAINPSGGLKARGHPIGATGVYQVAEGFLAVTEGLGKLGKVSTFLTHATNLFGASTYLTLLKEV